MQEAPRIPAEPLNPPASPSVPPAPDASLASPVSTAPGTPPATGSLEALGKLDAPLHLPIRTRRRNPRRHRPRSTPAQIMEILRAIHASDKHPAEACKEHQITLATYYRWRKNVQKMGVATKTTPVSEQPQPHGASGTNGYGAGYGIDTHISSNHSVDSHGVNGNNASSHGINTAHPAFTGTTTQRLHDTIVHLTMENVALKRQNAALLDIIAQRMQSNAPPLRDAHAPLAEPPHGEQPAPAASTATTEIAADTASAAFAG